MSRVILIEIASNSRNNFINPNRLEPLGIEYVSSHAAERGYTVEILSDTFDDIEDAINNIRIKEVDIVGISTFTYSFKKGLELARRIKKENEKIIIVFGGVHASSCPEIIKEDPIDFVVIGEGEESFVRLLNSIRNNNDTFNIKGIVDKSYFVDNNHGQPSKANDFINEDDDSYPLRIKYYIKSSRIFGLMYPTQKKQNGVAQLLHSRGCKYNCDYCSSSLVFGNKVRYRNVSAVVSEIKDLIAYYNINLFYFVDINFNNSKSQVHNLCDKIIRENLDINWYCLCNIKGLDRDILGHMKNAGCTKIGVGIETLNPQYIEEIKRCNLTEVRNTLSSADNLGLIIRGFFMLGFPWEKPEEIEEMPKALAEMPIDELRMPFFTPFPGTKSYFVHKKNITTDDFDNFSTNEPILKNDLISENRYIELRNNIYKSFYTSKTYQNRMKEKINRNPHLRESYNAFFEELYTEGII